MWWSKSKARVTEGAHALASPMIMFLEPRMLFDGAVAATVADAAQPDAQPTVEAAKPPTADQPADTHAPQGQVDATQAAVPGKSVLFVDSRVKESASLLEGVAPGTQVVQLEASKDGLQQIADYLDTHQGVSSVQIIAHGNAGDLWLGNSYLSADNVQARSEVLARIGQDMNVGGDILIYGCYTAEGERGLSLVDSLAQLTGRDVAASTDRTGLGGDWDLEIATGTIESANVLSASAMSEYQWGLATWTATNNLNSGVGSLRAALSSAQNGDIVTFNNTMTIALTQVLVVNRNVTIDGDLNNDNVADVTLDGQYRTQILQVTSGTTATLDGLVITRGMTAGNGGNGGDDALVSQGGGIYNAGTLTLKNVTVTANAASGGGGGGGVTPQYAGGGGGGGGAITGGTGGKGGDTLNSTGANGTAGQGGAGGGFFNIGGRGGSTTGGAGGAAYPGYSTGSAGGTASSGGLSIGGGGGGDGYDNFGGDGGGAVGGIYNDTGATLRVIGNSAISNNVGAGGGGGGGGAGGSYLQAGGAGGVGVGAIWNKGSILITAANFAALAGNIGGSGVGGTSAGTAGVSPASVSNVYGDGGTINTNYVPDETPPTSTVVVAITNLNSGGTSTVTITFSEAVTGLTAADLTVQNGTVGTLTSGDGGITWTGTLTAASNIADTTNIITLNNTGVADLAGNAGVGTTASNNYIVNDTVVPTASIVVSDTALRIGETSVVTITFSEAVSGFTSADLTVANGSISGLSTSDGGITWTATLTPDATVTDTSNLIVLNNTGVADLNGNAGVGTTNSNNYAIDTQRPTATLVVADTSLRIGETSVVTITFTEAVSGFTLADLTAANGSLSALSSSDGGITWTATLTPTASINDTTNLITLTNSGIADLSGNVGSGTTDSNNYAVDTLRPTATIVVADAALNIGETSLVTITFSEAVTGFTLADMTVANGSLSGLSSSDGGITWTATLTPSASTSDATNLLVLANTGVADAAGNAGSGTTSSNNYAVDTQRPTASIVVADTALSVGETSLVTLTFNEAVTGFTVADLTVANGTVTGLSSGDGGITWTGTLTPSASLSDTSNLITLDNTGVTDAAGNAGSGTTDSNNYAIDTARPTATLVVADTAIAVGETSVVTITFSEAVTGFTLADLSVTNGSLSGLSTSDNITYTATFTPSAGVSDATNLITLTNTGIVDGAGNTGSGTTDSNNYAVDTQRPTATIVVADNALSVGETSLVTVTFSEAVSGFDNSDLSVANGTLSAVSSVDGGVTWTATFTPALGVSDLSNVITLNNAGISDAAGNTGTGTTDSNNYQVDTNVPTATLVIADTTLSIGETSLVTVTFNSAVSGFDNSDLTVVNGTLSTMSSTDGGVTWTATFTPSANISDTSNLITLDNTGLINGAGNAGVGITDSNNYAVDTLRPTATIVMADTALNIGETSLVTITFSEAVTAFTSADLTVANGVISGLSSSDGGITWTATFTPTDGVTDSSNVITLNTGGIVDLAGNANVGTTDSNNYALDTQRPTATIVLADANLSVGETSVVTITFSEAVTRLTNDDLSVANGTLSAVSSSDGGLTWTAVFTPVLGVRDTTNLITLDNTGVSDAAGNTGTGTSNSANYSVDTQVPTATIVVADTALNIGETSQVTITFNEAVSGFDNSDLSVSNGTLSNVASADGGVTWTATFTPSANISDTSNLITLDNTGLINGAGNAGVGITDSNNYAVDTLRPTATIVMADTALNIGETSLVTITFSEAVTAFTSADLTVANGVISGLSSSDGGITWTATFTPTDGVTDSSNVITLNTGGIVDLAGNANVGTTDSNNYTLDTQRPTATIVLADANLSVGETSVVTITFSEAVTGLTNDDLSVANGTLSAVSSSDGGLTWTAVFTPVLGVRDTTNLITLDNTGVSDAAGNTGTGISNSANYSVDTQVPTATIVVADTALNIGETSQVTITFNEAVSGFDNSDLSVSNGTLSNVTSADGGVTWTATFTPSANISDTSNLITLDNTGLINGAGNAGVGITDSNNYAVDTLRPTATIVMADTALNIGETSLVTITFSEAVTAFTSADLTVANGVISGLSSSDGGITWTATFTPTDGVTDSSNVITLNTGGIVDLAGNANVGTTDSNNYTLDTQRPTATIVLADANLSVGETSVVTITFSEAVTGLTNDDLSVANGTLSAVSSSDGGLTWTAVFTPVLGVRDTTNLITLDNTGVSDAAGNTGTGTSNSANYSVDTQVPTATIVVADTALNIGETSQVTITFNEAVSGFDNGDLSVSNGTLSNVASADGGVTWTATFTPSANISDTSNLITLDNTGLINGAGNAGVGITDSNNYAVDTLRPTATIVMADTALNIGETSLVTITFSEAVTAFTSADLTVANGVISGLSSSDGGITWTATFTPTDGVTDSSNVITLNTGGIVDLAGNANVGTTDSNNYTLDTQRPTATIVLADANLSVGETSVVTITFSEAVTGLTNDDLSVANGTLSAVSSSDGGLTWTAVFTPVLGVRDTTNLITLDNTGVSDAAGNTGTGTSNSANYSVDTQVPTATIVVADTALNIGETSQVTITFNEAVSGFDNSDLSVSNGTLSNVTSADGGVTWTATFTPSANISDTSNLITLDNTGLINGAGNAGVGITDSNNYAVDTVRPIATISVADNNLGVGQTTTVTIGFSEAVSGFDLSDLSVANAVLSNLASSDGGKTWTATLTPTAAISDATNLIVLDASLVHDAAGNVGSGIVISNNFALDGERPTATISIANPTLTVGQSTTVTFTFSEKVSGFELDDLSVANGTLSNLATNDGGKTWTATLTPAANINDPSNFITLDSSLVVDLAGNAGSGFANSNNFAINTIALTGDPLFRVTTPTTPQDAPNPPLQPSIFGRPGGDLGSPIGFPPLFEQREMGGGLPPIGSIFINNGASSPSFIAQVFSTDGSGDGSGRGFLGFGGGDGGVFGSSTLSGLFNRDTGGSDTGFKAFDSTSIKGRGDAAQGLRGVFGAPTLGQQLQQINDSERRQVIEMAHALQQVGISEMQA